VTIWYRGASYQLGRGQHFYGIWAAGGPRSQPLEQWPETPEGWSAAWSRFTAIEAPGTVVHFSRRTAPVASAVNAVVLLAAGVACGIAGLFPAYLSGLSLAQQPAQLVPHAIYLAVWTASALLIWSGGSRRRVGTLLGLGTSIVTFGFFFADAGAVIAGGTHVLGLGLVLGLVGWLACTAGSTLAFGSRSAGAPRRPHARAMGPVVLLTLAVLAAVGAATAFAPSWDSYTLRTSAGLTQSLTAGNSFANPAPVIAGDVAVMVAFVVVVVAAVLWRPIRLGAALLAGAVVPMAAQVISALVQIGEPTSPAQFGISPASAAQAGLTISSGVTPAFWIYCVFVVALVTMCAWMLIPPRLSRPAGRAVAPPGSIPSPMPATAMTAEDSRDLAGAAGRQDGPAA
jgi:tryptophan-rich sensory protein